MAGTDEPRTTRRRFLVAASGIASATTLAGCISRPRRDGPNDHDDEPSNSGPSTGPDGNADAADSGWPQFGRDVGNTAHAPETSGPRSDPTIRWRFDAGTPTMNTSPVVVDGTVYVAGSGDPGYLYAVDAETGESEWQFEPAGYATSAPAVVDGVIYVGTWGKHFYAIDATTGEERWSTNVGHRFGPSSPAVVDGTVYVGTIGDGPLVVSGPEDEEKFEACALLALDAATGDERWRYDELGRKDNVASSPAVVGGRVYFGGSTPSTPWTPSRAKSSGSAASPLTRSRHPRSPTGSSTTGRR